MSGSRENVSKSEATEPGSIGWLKSLLGQNLRVHISDGRVFLGQFKCTDRDSNVILANSHEFRSAKFNNDKDEDVKSRYVGLIVVPGEHINKIELEEFDKRSVI